MHQLILDERINLPVNFKHWISIISDYTKRDLSNPADKLLAISAVAKAHFQSLEKPIQDSTRYLAGLWHHEMPLFLLWWVKRPSFKSPETLPSAILVMGIC